MARFFSDKILVLVHNKIYPLPQDVKSVFEGLRKELENAAVVTIDPNRPLVVETDASDVAIAATLNQDNRPVALLSRTLTPSERNHSAVEEAYAIVQSLRKWEHYLIGGHLTMITDQRRSLSCSTRDIMEKMIKLRDRE